MQSLILLIFFFLLISQGRADEAKKQVVPSPTSVSKKFAPEENAGGMTESRPSEEKKQEVRPSKEKTISEDNDSDQAAIKKLMADLRAANDGKNQKKKWNNSIYPDDGWKTHGRSVQGRPLIYFECGEKNANTTLMLSSVHGDEVTPVYFGFRLASWIKGEKDICRDYHVVIAPLVNPDGYLNSHSRRMNENGIDLNRNFPTKDFDEFAVRLWKTQGKSDPRRFPGDKGGSEPETNFQQWLIDTFKPSKILSVHSPLNFFDYDGPDSDDLKEFARAYVQSCNQLRAAVKKANPNYPFLRYGFFPGSLGNYAGKERGIPTLTLELPTTDAAKAKIYFEHLKRGTRQLVTYKVVGQEQAANRQHEDN